MSKALFGIGLALLLTASTVLAAPSPSFPAFLAAAPGASPAAVLDQTTAANSTPATPVDTSDCSPRKYSCQTCPSLAAPLKLCFTQTCGTFVIVHCDPCAPTCSLPPA